MGIVPDDNVLVKYADEHLVYEIEMSLSSAFKLHHLPRTSENQFMQNILLEGFCLHLRNLYDFLYLDAKGDDSSASHFFEDCTIWINLRPKSSQLEDARKRVNKEVAHLTYDRLNRTPDSKLWEFGVLAREIMVTLSTFARNASATKLGLKVPGTVDRWNKIINS